MKQHFNRILLIQGIVLTTLGGFANNTYSAINGNPVAAHYTRDTTAGNKTATVKTVLTESMVSFNAAYMSHAIDLNWKIANGNNYSQFTIERSVDGIHFEKVGEVKANAVSTMQDYSFTDFVKPALSRKNDLYYRLKQVDGSQEFSYSKVLIVRMYNSRSVTAVSVTPDPAINDILVNVQLKENAFVVMTVKDNSGSQVMRKTATAENGANSYSLDGTSQLKPGTYMLEVIINSNERMTMQLIKS